MIIAVLETFKYFRKRIDCSSISLSAFQAAILQSLLLQQIKVQLEVLFQGAEQRVN